MGHECDAYLALASRSFHDEPTPPRNYRIFRDGKRIEDQVLDDLRASGLTIVTRTDAGEQLGWHLLNGHISGHCDGVLLAGEESILLEIKSMKASKWRAMQRHGLAKSHPTYVAQVQALMWLAQHGQPYEGTPRIDFSGAIVVAYNKDTSEHHAELIERDNTVGSKVVLRASSIVLEERVIRRMGGEENGWPCAYCFKRTACWRGPTQDDMAKCSTCVHGHASISPGGQLRTWRCSYNGSVATSTCEHYSPWKPKP